MPAAFGAMARIGLAVLALTALVALFAPLLAPYPPASQHLEEGLSAPSPAHPLGQDRLGRDILSRIVYGAQVSMIVGLVVVAVSLAIGMAVGAFVGYLRGIYDDLVMRAIDILQAFPGILLAIAITAVLGPSLTNVIIALSVLGWVGFARIVRGQILAVRDQEFVLAARALGAGPTRLLARHMIPNILAPVIVEASFGIARAILAEAGLSFLGLGVQPPTPSWGAMINEGRAFLLLAPHLTIFPGLAIMAVVMALNFVGDGLRDALDVRDPHRAATGV